ncbi:MAG TPA: glycoside hydrolase family 3 N-terminal domain-containing protein [Streptosporangiaceae bacterium]|nr:glycoside hydrolase family 3 N-terminal domain-containing protein [Streptosporangiaceae bacterium]
MSSRITPGSPAWLAESVIIPPFPGTAPPRWLLDALGRGLAGVTLYGQNVTGDTAALTATLRSAADASGLPPLICIDEEGGDVTRVAYASGSPYPGNAALGAVDDVALTTAVYAAIGDDLARLGINMNLAPCADVLAVSDSPAIGTRSFGSSTSLVARHTAAAVHGLQSAMVAACAKHFPGHGSTSVDTHHALATISGTLAEVRDRDVPPFAAAITAGAAAVMPGHLLVPELTGSLPATMSPAAISMLRGELGFTGVVVSDGLEMQAVSGHYGIPATAAQALAAGVDLLCFGQHTDHDVYRAVCAAVADAVQTGDLPLARLEEASERVRALRSRLCDPDQPVEGVPEGLGVTPNGVGLAAARRAVRVAGPLPVLTDPLIIEVEPRENVAAGQFGWGLSPWAPPSAVRRLDPAGPLDPAAILTDASGRSLVVAVRDAHVDSRTRNLITALLAARPDTVLIEMGLPHWAPPAGTSYLATFGASRASAQAAAELLGLAT